MEAAEPLGVPVFPALPYGLTPYFREFPGSPSLRVSTYASVLKELLDSLKTTGFRRILLCNGHGGNQPAQAIAAEWMADNPGTRVILHNWWNAPQTWQKCLEIDPVCSHASWTENFPWTRLAGVVMPGEQKPLADFARLRMLNPKEVRQAIGDGNYGGYYQRSDEEMLAIWQVAVAETRALLTGSWGS